MSQQVAMGCRKDTNAYPVHMAVIGPQSTAEKPEDPKLGILGVAPAIGTSYRRTGRPRGADDS